MSSFRTTASSVRRYLRDLVRPGPRPADEFADAVAGTTTTRHADGSTSIHDPAARTDDEVEDEMRKQMTIHIDGTPSPAATPTANTTPKRKQRNGK